MKNPMKQLMKRVLAIALILTGFQLRAQEFNGTVIPEKSELKWKAYKVGGYHEGLVQVKSGTFTAIDKQITQGTFVVDMTTIKVTDTESPKLLNHLRSADFFDVDNHKEATLIIESTHPAEGDEFEAHGIITIRGTSMPIIFAVKIFAETDNFISYKASMSIDRTKFGIVYRSSAVGDSFIMDNFDIQVKITAKKN